MGEKEVWRGGELVIWGLKEEGVNCIFGLSGGHIEGIFDACIDHGIRIIDTRHEQAAVIWRKDGQGSPEGLVWR